MNLLDDLKFNGQTNSVKLPIIRIFYLGLLVTSLLMTLNQSIRVLIDQNVIDPVLIGYKGIQTIIYILVIIYNTNQLIEEFKKSENIITTKHFRLLSIFVYLIHIVFILCTIDDLLNVNSIFFRIAVFAFLICSGLIAFADVNLLRLSKINERILK